MAISISIEPRQTVNEQTELYPTNANFEGIKLDMAILESRLFTALSESEDRHESDINLLRLKLREM